MNMIPCLPTTKIFLFVFSVPPITPRKSLYKVDTLHAKKTYSGIHFSICLHYIID